MKKFFTAVALCLLIIFTCAVFAACGSNPDGNGNSGAGTAAAGSPAVEQSEVEQSENGESNSTLRQPDATADIADIEYLTFDQKETLIGKVSPIITSYCNDNGYTDMQAGNAYTAFYNTDALFFVRISIWEGTTLVADVYLCGNSDYAAALKNEFTSETLKEVVTVKGKIVVAEETGIHALSQAIESANLEVKV